MGRPKTNERRCPKSFGCGTGGVDFGISQGVPSADARMRACLFGRRLAQERTRESGEPGGAFGQRSAAKISFARLPTIGGCDGATARAGRTFCRAFESRRKKS